jgi:DNA adenine methylase
VPYSGGKQGVARAIADTFPSHSSYVEPFGGALSVLLAKPPAKVEIVNDLNGDLMAFWRVLRDRPAELERVCGLTPHSRAEFLAARDLTGVSELERARRVWVQLTQGRGARLTTSTGWRFVHGTNQMPLAKYLDGYLPRIGPCANRLRQVSLENRPALDLIRGYDRPGALFYLDPPYPAHTRGGGAQYPHEMLGDTEHQELLQAAVSAAPWWRSLGTTAISTAISSPDGRSTALRQPR